MFTRKIMGHFFGIFFTLFLGFTQQVTSQSLWFQPGTQWTHSIDSPVITGFIVTKLEKDTVINSIPCKKFTKTAYIFSDSPIGTTYNQGETPVDYTPLLAIDTVAPIYMYATADDNEVYYFEEGVFIKMYDFDAPVGEILTLPYPTNVLGLGATLCPNRNFVISATGSEVIDGETLKWIELAATPETGYSYSGKIYQKIGSTTRSFYPLVQDGNPNDMCGSIPSDFNFDGNFLCFKDDAFAEPVNQGGCYIGYSCKDFLEINPPFLLFGPPFVTNEIPGGIYEASINIQSTAIVPNNTVFSAGSTICLDSGFTVEVGAIFEAKIEGCSL